MTRRTSRPDGPLGALGGGSGDLWTDTLLLAGVGAVLAGVVGTVYWAAGAALSLVTGHGAGPSLPDAARRVLGGQPLGQVWDGVPTAAVLVLGSVLLAALVWACMAGIGWWRAAHPARDGYSDARQLGPLVPGRAADVAARRLRPSLRTPQQRAGAGRGRSLRQAVGLADLPQGVPEGERGVPLGRLARPTSPWPRLEAGLGGGPVARTTWEDVVLAICAPRSGKTTCLAVPAVLDAPGPVLATSNKPDLWALTAAPRAELTDEQVWAFDPQQINGTRQTFVWNPLDGVHTVADARRLAGHFIQEIRRSADHADFWDRDAEDLLTGLLLAAAVDDAPLPQVATWLTAVSAVEPRNILRRVGFTHLADVMAGRAHGAHETREGVYATARAAAACLADPQVLAWVTPRQGLEVFDPVAFVRSRQTLYLLSKDGAGSAAPLVAAFADRLMLEAVRAAEHAPGTRLDPPLVAVLDEAANICRITELPRLYSHLGSRGIVPLTILQSRSQGRRVWGEAGMDELFSAATIKVIGAGLDDPAFAEEISRLLGDEDVLVTTRSHGKTGGTSTTTRRERVLPADEVRALPKFTALLLVTGVRPAVLRLVPWMSGPHAALIRSQPPGGQR